MWLDKVQSELRRQVKTDDWLGKVADVNYPSYNPRFDY